MEFMSLEKDLRQCNDGGGSVIKFPNPESPLLHIHAQHAWHGHATIVGNETGLKALREAIDKALQDGLHGAEEFCADGEGYFACVIHSEDMEDVPLGYTYDIAQDNRPYPERIAKAINKCCGYEEVEA